MADEARPDIQYRHVAEYFIKYLVLRHWDNVEWEVEVEQEVASLWYQTPLPGYIAGIRARLNIPDDYRPWDPTHKHTRNFLKAEQVDSLFFPDPDVHSAKKLLGEPAIRACLQALLLIHDQNNESAAINLHLSIGAMVEPAVIKLFKHYFFNSRLLSWDQWAFYLSRESMPDNRYRNIMETARTAGNEAALHKLGVEAERLDSQAVLKDTQAMLYHTLREVYYQPLDFSKVKMMGTLAKGLVDIDIRMSQADSAMANVMDQLKEFQLAPKGTTVIDMQELTGGRHTGSSPKRINSGDDDGVVH